MFLALCVSVCVCVCNLTELPFYWPQHHVACKILVPQPEMELMPPQWNCLNTGPPGTRITSFKIETHRSSFPIIFLFLEICEGPGLLNP